MKDWKKILVAPSDTILEVIRIIDEGALKIALVVDAAGRLLGTVSDGDVRRAILRGVPLGNSVAEVMNNSPLAATTDMRRNDIFALMRNRNIHQVPILDKKGVLIGLEALQDLLKQNANQESWVVIMAGGLGSRLRPMTDDCPKPMLKVGGRPVLETILESFADHGFRHFFFAVNYRAEMIEEYFGDGSRFGVEITYLHEEKRLGTAGALSLLPQRPEHPIVVMNGDLLTKINFEQLLAFHSDHKAQATMCVREYDFQVPYGVAILEGSRLVAIEEKPLHKFFVNAGIYVLEPDVLDMVVEDQYCDMTTIFERLTEERREVIAFPLREYWIDLGRMEDFLRAQGDYVEVFG